MEPDGLEQPTPTTVALLGRVLQLQAASYMIAALAASTTYLVRGGTAWISADTPACGPTR
jgi:hypothetical protein